MSSFFGLSHDLMVFTMNPAQFALHEDLSSYPHTHTLAGMDFLDALHISILGHGEKLYQWF
jgi:pantothenate synthetase